MAEESHRRFSPADRLPQDCIGASDLLEVWEVRLMQTSHRVLLLVITPGRLYIIGYE